jgi:hypothetical protein
MVVWIVPLHNILSPVQPVEHYTHFNKRNPQTLNHQRNQDYSHLKFSDNEVSAVLSFRVSPNAFAPSAPIRLSADTPEWRDPNTNSAKTIPMGDTANRQSQQPQQSHSIHGGMDRGSPQSTLNSPTNTSTKQTQKHHSRTKPRKNETTAIKMQCDIPEGRLCQHTSFPEMNEGDTY